MNLTAFFIALGVITLAAIVIMYAAESFEDSSRYLGRRMPAGIRGATINAIASSLPELLTTAAFLLFFHEENGFAAGVATCAGSAVFNAVIIPAACLLAVSIKGVKIDGSLQKIDAIDISHSTLIRDGFFFVLAEAALIYFLSGNTMTWWMGGALVGIYLFYFSYLMYQFKIGALEEEEDQEDEEDEDDQQTSKLGALLRFEFNEVFFDGEDFTTFSAWVNIILTTAIIAIACHFLAEYVIHAADALDIPSYFAAVILGAAATSVPDTFISVGDALEGDYDDAISNAIGSNIFDITLALGLPLLVYAWFFKEDGALKLIYDEAVGATATEVQELRIVLLITTILIMGIFLLSEKFGRKKATAFIGVYILWTVYVLGRAMEWPWLMALIN